MKGLSIIISKSIVEVLNKLENDEDSSHGVRILSE